MLDLFALGLLEGPAITYEASRTMYHLEMHLSDCERNKIMREIEFAINRMYGCLDCAEFEASMIADVDLREGAIGAIEGAIAGLGGRSPYTVVIGGCLGALSRLAGNSCRHYMRSRDYVEDARTYAKIADKLQERLWRDE